MCPNLGSHDAQSLLRITRHNADNKLFTTFVGIGLDFDTNLTEVQKFLGVTLLTFSLTTKCFPRKLPRPGDAITTA
jgi:hypothetical protein